MATLNPDANTPLYQAGSLATQVSNATGVNQPLPQPIEKDHFSFVKSPSYTNMIGFTGQRGNYFGNTLNVPLSGPLRQYINQWRAANPGSSFLMSDRALMQQFAEEQKAKAKAGTQQPPGTPPAPGARPAQEDPRPDPFQEAFGGIDQQPVPTPMSQAESPGAVQMQGALPRTRRAYVPGSWNQRQATVSKAQADAAFYRALIRGTRTRGT